MGKPGRGVSRWRLARSPGPVPTLTRRGNPSGISSGWIRFFLTGFRTFRQKDSKQLSTAQL
jgi:hypothetical protein